MNKAPLVTGVLGARLRTLKGIVANLFQLPKLDPNKVTPFNYSNAGYSVLAHIVERVSGKAYGEFLQSEFFRPFGMKQTGIDHDSLVLSDRAFGYVEKDGSLYHRCCYDIQNFIGAGSIHSTTSDLMHWLWKVKTHEVLNDTNLLFPPHVETKPASGYFYGYGWVVRNQNPRVYLHDGQVDGYHSLLAYYPDRKMTLVVLGNLHTYPLKHIPFKIRQLFEDLFL